MPAGPFRNSQLAMSAKQSPMSKPVAPGVYLFFMAWVMTACEMLAVALPLPWRRLRSIRGKQ
jgi:hypothetical protein